MFSDELEEENVFTKIAQIDNKQLDNKDKLSWKLILKRYNLDEEIFGFGNRALLVG